jgi:hypothetical protein
MAHKYVYIFAGQSNILGADSLIAGTGTQDLFDAGLQQTADTQALLSVDIDAAGTDLYGFGDVRGHEDDVGSGVYIHGPEVGFVRTIYNPSEVAIIKFHANHSALESGRSPWIKGNTLYTALAAAITQRTGELTSAGHTWEIAGFVWNQGIDEGKLYHDYVNYKADLRNVITNLRADYSATRFVLMRSINVDGGGITPWHMHPIRRAQVEVANEDGDVIWYDCDDLTPYVNNWHLTAANQIISGQRAAQAMAMGTQSIAVDVYGFPLVFAANKFGNIHSTINFDPYSAAELAALNLESAYTTEDVRTTIVPVDTKFRRTSDDGDDRFVAVSAAPTGNDLSNLQEYVMANVAYGEISVEGNATTTTFAGASTDFSNATQVLIFDTNHGSSSAVTPDHTNDHLTLGATGTYFVKAEISFSGGISDTYSFAVFKNNGATQLTPRTTRMLGTGGDVGSASCSGIFAGTSGDTIEAWMQNEDDTSAATVQDCTLTVFRID